MSAAGQEKQDVVIAGGGPAGLLAGLLFARAGLRTTVIEKHRDFLRDFRGDTVHPSTLRIFAELGLLDRLLERPHDRVRRIGGLFGDRHYEIADFSRIDPRWGFVAMMPQWEFLDFVAAEARRFPGFRLIMNMEATNLVRDDHGRIIGLDGQSHGCESRIYGDLMIVADGRDSRLRAAAGLKPTRLGAPIDIFWFRLPKTRNDENQSQGIFIPGRILVLIDRGDYWQCAYVFSKGEAACVQARGLPAFREEIGRAAARLAPAVETITAWEDVKLLTVAMDRLERWHLPGLLVIGDAAHAMSPVGGVGINLAIQDAVAAANILAGAMAEGRSIDSLLPKVERRRRSPVRMTQAFQRAAQERVIAPLLAAGPDAAMKPPLAIRLFDQFPILRALPAAFLGLGIKAEHVRSPEAGTAASGEDK